MTAPILIARFDDEHGPARGKPLVAAARDAGCSWVAIRVGESVGGLRATVEAGAAEGIGVMVELGSTLAISGLQEACAALAPLTVPALRDRLLVVVPGERFGRRMRADARWAPSALDLDGHSGFRLRLARAFPNHHRAQADCDDLVVPHGMFEGDRLAKIAGTLRLRGARLIVDRAPRDEAASLAARGVHGLIVDARA